MISTYVSIRSKCVTCEAFLQWNFLKVVLWSFMNLVDLFTLFGVMYCRIPNCRRKGVSKSFFWGSQKIRVFVTSWGRKGRKGPLPSRQCVNLPAKLPKSVLQMPWKVKDTPFEYIRNGPKQCFWRPIPKILLGQRPIPKIFLGQRLKFPVGPFLKYISPGLPKG